MQKDILIVIYEIIIHFNLKAKYLKIIFNQKFKFYLYIN